MKKTNFLKRAKFFLTAMFLLWIVLINAQSSPKFDRNFQLLYQNKDLVSKGGKITMQSPHPLDTKMVKGSNEVLYSCIIYTKDAQALRDKGIKVQSVLPNFVTALIKISDLDALLQMKEVKFVKSPSILNTNNDISVGQSGAALLQAGALNNTVYKGKGVLVGVFDSGIYWRHPDFRDANGQTNSRILKMWDQTLTPEGTEVSPTGFSYGVEYTQTQINAELSGATSGVIREVDSIGHGTHVAGTAAGNGSALASKKYTGMAPEANYIIVKGGNGSFSSSNVIDGLSYFNNVATALNMPIVVNMSLGGKFGAHDGTGNQAVAVDRFSNSGPGRAVVISAGNDNGLNYHKQATIAAGETATIDFRVASDVESSWLFAFLLYSSSSDDFTATLTTPSGDTATTAANSSSSQNVMDGKFIYLADNYIDEDNNDRYLNMYIARASGSEADSSGTWSLSITNNGSSTIIIDGWIYNKKVATMVTGGDSNYLIGSPGDAKTAITTASYTGRLSWYSNNTGTSGGYVYSSTSKSIDGLSTFSSYGPLRGGAQKPDIAAVGEVVISCLSSGVIPTLYPGNVDGNYYQIMSGTSMSAPGVTGAVALLFQAKPTATYKDIKNALTATTQRNVATATSLPNYTWGYGKLDVFQAASYLLGSNLKRKTYLNEISPYSLASDVVTEYTTEKLAQIYLPDISGYFGGVFFHTSTAYSGVTSFTVEVRNDDGGTPGTTLLGSKSIDISSLASGRLNWNYFDLSDLKINVESGTSYFVVIYAGGASPKWAIRSQVTNTNSTSQMSSDSGSNWSTAPHGYRIRSVVYESPALLATSENKIKEIAIYPNPVIDILKIKLTKNQKSNLKVFDMSGRLVKEMDADSENIELNVSSLPKGSYVLKISSDGKNANKKFIKN